MKSVLHWTGQLLRGFREGEIPADPALPADRLEDTPATLVDSDQCGLSLSVFTGGDFRRPADADLVPVLFPADAPLNFSFGGVANRVFLQRLGHISEELPGMFRVAPSPEVIRDDRCLQLNFRRYFTGDHLATSSPGDLFPAFCPRL